MMEPQHGVKQSTNDDEHHPPLVVKTLGECYSVGIQASDLSMDLLPVFDPNLGRTPDLLIP